MEKMVLATNNQGKVKDFRGLFSAYDLEILPMSAFSSDFDPEETGASFADNAAIKAFAGRKVSGLSCLADDSGLSLPALDGAPGIYSARYAAGQPQGLTPGLSVDEANNKRLLRELEGVEKERRGAFFICVLCLALADGSYLLGRGQVAGQILEAPQGQGGFGYDPLFYIPSLEKTMAQLSLEEKNQISHRKMAFLDLERALMESGRRLAKK